MYDSISNQTYSVDPNSPTNRATDFYSVIGFVSESGLAIGFDNSYASGLTTAGGNLADRVFVWHLRGSAHNVPVFTYLDAFQAKNEVWELQQS